MAVHGYVTHAAHNRRFTAWLVVAYLFAFQLLGAFALTLFILFFDPDHSIITNPGGYALRYALPIAALSAFLFWRMYRGHARFLTHALGVRLVSRADEPRFVRIAEEQCTALGVRFPRFGVIEAVEPNVATAGEGSKSGLIAVTRGLLDLLDDDELAAVLAHEASHIRQGDTRLLAANHALMRTAVLFQTHNPLRLEDWRQMIIPLLMPPMLLLILAGNFATMVSMRLAFAARRGLKVGRDHVADGEAVRVTHFPEALFSALEKVGGRGAFEGSRAVEGLLFDGPVDHDGGTHSPVADRMTAIAALGRDMMDPNRQRRDTRAPVQGARPVFGRNRRHLPATLPETRTATAFARAESLRPPEQPPTPTLRMTWLWITDREEFWRWQHACIAWYEWRADDRRNAIGLTPKMILPVAVTCTFLLVFHWPADGDLSKLKNIFNPTVLVEIAQEMNGGTFCSGPSYPDGRCAGEGVGKLRTVDPPAVDAANARVGGVFTDKPKPGLSSAGSPPDRSMALLPFMMMCLIVVGIFRPSWLRKLFGVVERK